MFGQELAAKVQLLGLTLDRADVWAESGCEGQRRHQPNEDELPRGLRSRQRLGQGEQRIDAGVVLGATMIDS
jgi:hypothetical protein